MLMFVIVDWFMIDCVCWLLIADCWMSIVVLDWFMMECDCWLLIVIVGCCSYSQSLTCYSSYLVSSSWHIILVCSSFLHHLITFHFCLSLFFTSFISVCNWRFGQIWNFKECTRLRLELIISITQHKPQQQHHHQHISNINTIINIIKQSPINIDNNNKKMMNSNNQHWNNYSSNSSK